MFKVKIHLPVSGIDTYVSELKYSQFRVLQKLIANDDDDLISEYFIEIMKSCCDLSDDQIYKLNVIDKAILLLTVKQYNVKRVITLKVKKHNLEVKLDNMINAISECGIKEKRIKIENFEVVVTPPVDLFADSAEDLVFNGCISDVLHKGKSVLTSSTKDNIIELLPSTIFSHIKDYLVECEEIVSKIRLINYGQMDPEKEDVYMSVVNNFVYHLLKVLYQQDLNSLYDIEYILASKVNLTLDQLDRLSPIEVDIYLSKYSREVKQQEAQMKESNKGSGGIPMGRR